MYNIYSKGEKTSLELEIHNIVNVWKCNLWVVKRKTLRQIALCSVSNYDFPFWKISNSILPFHVNTLKSSSCHRIPTQQWWHRRIRLVRCGIDEWSQIYPFDRGMNIKYIAYESKCKRKRGCDKLNHNHFSLLLCLFSMCFMRWCSATGSMNRMLEAGMK